MNDICRPDFWLTFAPFGTASLVLGFLLGRLSETHKEQTMHLIARARNWFDRNFRWLYFMALVLAVVGITIGAAASLTNSRQDEDRDRLLACFDDYATASSSATTKVRAATVEVDVKTSARDLAASERDLALDAVFEYIASDPPEDDPEGVALFLTLLSANADLVAVNADLVMAQAELDKVRKDNPVPDPPSKFCDD